MASNPAASPRICNPAQGGMPCFAKISYLGRPVPSAGIGTDSTCRDASVSSSPPSLASRWYSPTRRTPSLSAAVGADRRFHGPRARAAAAPEAWGLAPAASRATGPRRDQVPSGARVRSADPAFAPATASDPAREAAASRVDPRRDPSAAIDPRSAGARA